MQRRSHTAGELSTTTHEYVTDLAGTGSTLAVNLHDCLPGDNTTAAGAQLTLSIFGPPASAPPIVGSINGPIAFTSTRDSATGDVYVMGATGSLPTRLTADPGIDIDPAWSPDGATIAFSSNRNGNFDIFAMGADGATPTPLTSDPANDRQATWSPDGSKIAFVSDRDGNDEIYVMAADGTGPVRLTNNPAPEMPSPAWSPDGSMLAFASNRDGNNEIYVMGATGSGAVNITNDAAADNSPTWSPDATSVAFSSDRDGDFEIFTSPADGAAAVQLTSNAVLDGDPSWSPDGTTIGFTSLRDGDFELYVMGADGANQANLTSNPGSDDSFDWRHSTVAAPTAPLAPSAAAGATGLVVSWSAPAAGGPVTGYVVTCTQGATTQRVSVGANTFTATVVGLNGSTPIDCTIVPTSASGSGAATSVTFTPTTTVNHTPAAVLDLVNTTDGTPGVPVFSSDDSRLNLPVRITQNADDLGLLNFDASRSNDLDGRERHRLVHDHPHRSTRLATSTEQTFTSPTGTSRRYPARTRRQPPGRCARRDRRRWSDEHGVGRGHTAADSTHGHEPATHGDPDRDEGQCQFRRRCERRSRAELRPGSPRRHRQLGHCVVDTRRGGRGCRPARAHLLEPFRSRSPSTNDPASCTSNSWCTTATERRATRSRSSPSTSAGRPSTTVELPGAVLAARQSSLAPGASSVGPVTQDAGLRLEHRFGLREPRPVQDGLDRHHRHLR